MLGAVEIGFRPERIFFVESGIAWQVAIGCFAMGLTEGPLRVFKSAFTVTLTNDSYWRALAVSGFVMSSAKRPLHRSSRLDEGEAFSGMIACV